MQLMDLIIEKREAMQEMVKSRKYGPLNGIRHIIEMSDDEIRSNPDKVVDYLKRTPDYAKYEIIKDTNFNPWELI